MGTREEHRGAKAWDKDHPHACGDKTAEGLCTGRTIGSSPRVWGQEVGRTIYQAIGGIIPTRVGTSISVMRADDNVQDHPHACGDKFSTPRFSCLLVGSSPRVWGQVSKVVLLLPSRRIIPTRVGTRLKKSRKIAVLQNQPLRFPLTFHRSFV